MGVETQGGQQGFRRNGGFRRRQLGKFRQRVGEQGQGRQTAAAGFLEGKGGNPQFKVVLHLRQRRNLRGGIASVIIPAAVPEEQHNLPGFLRRRQGADGKGAVHADAHEFRQIGSGKGAEKVTVDRGFVKGIQKGGL